MDSEIETASYHDRKENEEIVVKTNETQPENSTSVDQTRSPSRKVIKSSTDNDDRKMVFDENVRDRSRSPTKSQRPQKNLLIKKLYT